MTCDQVHIPQNICVALNQFPGTAHNIYAITITNAMGEYSTYLYTHMYSHTLVSQGTNTYAYDEHNSFRDAKTQERDSASVSNVNYLSTQSITI